MFNQKLKKYSRIGEMREHGTRIESEGSEPDRAACLAAARLSTSSAASPHIYNHNPDGRKMTRKSEITVKLNLTNQNKYQIVFLFYHLLNFLEKLCNLRLKNILYKLHILNPNSCLQRAEISTMYQFATLGEPFTE